MTQLEFKTDRAGISQCERILAHLRARAGHWVPMPDLWRASGAFAVHSRIADLRARGHSIDQKNERHKHPCKSYYRLNLHAPTPKAQSTPNAPGERRV